MAPPVPEDREQEIFLSGDNFETMGR